MTPPKSMRFRYVVNGRLTVHQTLFTPPLRADEYSHSKKGIENIYIELILYFNQIFMGISKTIKIKKKTMRDEIDFFYNWP